MKCSHGLILLLSTIVLVFVVCNAIKYFKSGFLEFPPFSGALVNPNVREEIGLSQVYPQGDGVGMNLANSNQLSPYVWNEELLIKHMTPNSIGESDLADPLGNRGSMQSARILEIGTTGRQDLFQPVDAASGLAFLSGNQGIDYRQNFNPSQAMKLAVSAGKRIPNAPCQSTIPYNYQSDDGTCVTAGDLEYFKPNPPYNPRMLSKWQANLNTPEAETYYGDEDLSLCGGNVYPNR